MTRTFNDLSCRKPRDISLALYKPLFFLFLFEMWEEVNNNGQTDNLKLHRFLHKYILKVKDIFKLCEKFWLYQSGVQQN